jgi:hypothetical protein
MRSVFVLVIALAGCTYHGPGVEELATQTIVITKFAPDVDFGAFRTFATGDTIEVLTDDGDGGQTVTATVDPALARAAYDAFANELTARGYRRVDRADNPDLGASLTAAIRQSAVVPYGAWWGFGSATGGFWGFGGSTLASGLTAPGVVFWRSGALILELLDLRAARAAPQSGVTPAALATSPPLDVIWGGFIYGVLGPGTQGTFRTPSPAPIQQAFAQSPYLKERP